MLTKNELIDLLDGEEAFEVSFPWGDDEPLKVMVDGSWVEYDVVYFDGGEEGDWRKSTYMIISATFDGVETFIRKDGYYASHDGSYWDGPAREVKPVVKTVVVYE